MFWRVSGVFGDFSGFAVKQKRRGKLFARHRHVITNVVAVDDIAIELTAIGRAHADILDPALRKGLVGALVELTQRGHGLVTREDDLPELGWHGG